MCGRAACTLAPQKLLEITNAIKWVESSEPNKSYQPGYNIAPTSILPVIVLNRDSKFVIKEMRWGIIPSFSCTGASEYNSINARSETVFTKKTFKYVDLRPYKNNNFLILRN